MPSASEIIPGNPVVFREVHDISAPLSGAPAYPGDRQYSQDWVARLDEGKEYSLSALALSSHAGTHLDFPSHLLEKGRTQDGYSLRRFIVPAQVVSVDDGAETVMPCSISECRISKGDALLFQTGNSRRRLMNQGVFTKDYVCLSRETARMCAARGASLVGIDYLSVDKYDDNSLPVHRILLENNILILEGIDLAAVPCGNYTLICLPLSSKNAEASPVRAALVR